MDQPTPETEIDQILDTLRTKLMDHDSSNTEIGWNRVYEQQQDALDEASRALVNLLNRSRIEAPPASWWVTDHDNDRKVAGPFTTDSDAGKARAILEKFEDHHNYWLEKLQTPPATEDAAVMLPSQF